MGLTETLWPVTHKAGSNVQGVFLKQPIRCSSNKR